MMDSLVAGAAKLGIDLSPTQVEQFQLYFNLLVSWNQRTNLTSILEYADVQIRHFLDSLSTILAFKERLQESDGAGIMLIDVGSGAGLPGIPLKIIFPKTSLMLVESIGKKTAFLHELLIKLELSNIRVANGRAEDLAHQHDLRESFDIALARALARMPTLAELTLPFCRLGGIVVAQKKGDFSEELEQAGPAISLFGGRVREIRKIELPGLSDDRCLVVVEKISLTPERYPRRPGIPEKRPILTAVPGITT